MPPPSQWTNRRAQYFIDNDHQHDIPEQVHGDFSNFLQFHGRTEDELRVVMAIAAAPDADADADADTTRAAAAASSSSSSSSKHHHHNNAAAAGMC